MLKMVMKIDEEKEANNNNNTGQIDKKDYWNNELKSLGVHPKRKNELNDKEELQNLADSIKLSMYQDYKTAYSKDGDKHKEEAKATVHP